MPKRTQPGGRRNGQVGGPGEQGSRHILAALSWGRPGHEPAEPSSSARGPWTGSTGLTRVMQARLLDSPPQRYPIPACTAPALR